MSKAPSTRSLEILLQLISPARRYHVPASSVDWDEIDHIARHSHVTVALWQRLRSDPLFHSMPPNMVIDLRRTVGESVRQNWLLRTQFIDAVRILNREQEVPILLKGAAYLFDPPSNSIARRYLHDLDLLSAAPDTCQAALLNAGFETHEKDVPNWHHHLPALLDPKTGLEVEVHRRPFKTADDAMVQVHLGDTVAHRVEGAHFLLPSHACRIADNVIHAQISDNSFAQGKFNPRYLLEFAEFALAWSAADWARAEIILEGNNVAYGNFRYLAKELMGVEPPCPRGRRHVDTIQLKRVRQRSNILQKRNWISHLFGQVIQAKDLARRFFGRWVGWQSVSHKHLADTGSNR